MSMSSTPASSPLPGPSPREDAQPPSQLLYTFYGDDFTGSTDVLEQLAAAGVSSALFLAPPTAAQLERFPGLRALGVAGDSRSRSPAWMTEHLPSIFRALRHFRAPITHYKVCSTFDSSPTTGSIGRAIELGLAVFAPPVVPIVVGAPHLRRFVLDGKLFASAPDGQIHRIDRHPMNRHPVTPMREPDLRRHLAAQTALPIGLVSHDDLRSDEAASAALDSLLAQGKRVVLFDTADAASLDRIGDLLWARAQRQPLFSASSSGLTSALIAAWRAAGLLSAPTHNARPRSIPQLATLQTAEPEIPTSSIQTPAPLLVVSGSCSAMTAQTIQWSLDHGWRGIVIDPARLTSAETASDYRHTLLDRTLTSLAEGRDTVLYTALGQPTTVPSGKAPGIAPETGPDSGTGSGPSTAPDTASDTETGGHLGAALGHLLRDILARSAVRRVVLCGGDTSSHAVQQLGLLALTWSASLQPGVPLCRAHFPDPSAPPLELVLKGGQVGSADFFAIAKAAQAAASGV